MLLSDAVMTFLDSNPLSPHHRNPQKSLLIGRNLIGLDKQKKFQRKIVNIFLPISFNICFGCGAQKNRLIEMVLLSTHNICFGWEIRKLNFHYTRLTKVLNLGWVHSRYYEQHIRADLGKWHRLGCTVTNVCVSIILFSLTSLIDDITISKNSITVMLSSVVECLTRDWGFVGLNLTCAAALCPWAKLIYLC